MIVGISGKARAGKDLLFSIAQKTGNWRKASFANRLKEIVREHFKLAHEHTDGWLKDAPCPALQDHTPRELLIDLGNLYRKYAENYWVEAALSSLNSADNYIFTDVRYINEAETIRYYGGFLIRLERHPDRDALVDDATKTSISETALDNYKKWDFVLPAENNKTPEDLSAFWSAVEATIQMKL